MHRLLFLAALICPFAARAEVDAESISRRLVERGVVTFVADEGRPQFRKPVMVVIESTDRNVELVEILGRTTAVVGGYVGFGVSTRPACKTPCNDVVEGHTSARYSIGGKGITPSEEFDLSVADAVRLKVKAGSAGAQFGGILLTYTGVPLILTGGLLLFMVQQLGSLSSTFGTGSILFPTALVTLGLGVAMTAAGIPLWVMNGTTVEIEPTQLPPAARPQPAGI